MEEELKNHILADAGITNLVGNRVHWNERPQAKALPDILLRLVNNAPDYHSTGPSGLEDALIQVDCYGETYSSAKLTSRAIKSLLSGAQFTEGNIVFDGIFIEGETDTFEALPSGAEKYHRVRLDIRVWHSLAS